MFLQVEDLAISGFPDLVMSAIAVQLESSFARQRSFDRMPGVLMAHPLTRLHVEFYRQLSNRPELSSDTRDFLRRLVSIFDGA